MHKHGIHVILVLYFVCIIGNGVAAVHCMAYCQSIAKLRERGEGLSLSVIIQTQSFDVGWGNSLLFFQTTQFHGQSMTKVRNIGGGWHLPGFTIWKRVFHVCRSTTWASMYPCTLFFTLYSTFPPFQPKPFTAWTKILQNSELIKRDLLYCSGVWNPYF